MSLFVTDRKKWFAAGAQPLGKTFISYDVNFMGPLVLKDSSKAANVEVTFS